METAMNTTAQRLATLAQLYQQGQASEMMDRTLDKLLAHEADEARAQLAVLAADLATFEQQYEMSSAEFARRYEAGQTDDRMDFVEWASLVRMHANLQQRLQLLTGEPSPVTPAEYLNSVKEHLLTEHCHRNRYPAGTAYC